MARHSDRKTWWPDDVVVSHEDAATAAEVAREGRRVQRTWYLSQEIVDRARATIYWAHGTAHSRAAQAGRQVDVDQLTQLPDSLTSLAETALWAEVMRLERLLNDGHPFPPAPGELRRGGRLGRPMRPRNTD